MYWKDDFSDDISLTNRNGKTDFLPPNKIQQREKRKMFFFCYKPSARLGKINIDDGNLESAVLPCASFSFSVVFWWEEKITNNILRGKFLSIFWINRKLPVFQGEDRGWCIGAQFYRIFWAIFECERWAWLVSWEPKTLNNYPLIKLWFKNLQN